MPDAINDKFKGFVHDKLPGGNGTLNKRHSNIGKF